MFVVHFVAISGRSDRPEDWVPEEDASVDYDICDEISEMPSASSDKDTVDIFSGDSYDNAGMRFLLFFTGHYEIVCDVVTTKVQGIELSTG